MATTLDWHRYYGKSWSGAIVPESFAHPAKFSCALIRRIYAHTFERGWLKPGDTVLDPFAGVALGALEAMRRGLHWVGVELERNFCDMGQGCECTGISKADWVRFHGRWQKGRYLDGRHWCPRCMAQVKQIAGERRNGRVIPFPRWPRESTQAPSQLTLGLDVPRAQTASYRRNSGKIPSTHAHHYQGNLERWHELGLKGSAVLLQGDSRELARVVAEVGALVSSPPYARDRVHQPGTFHKEAFSDPNKCGRNAQAFTMIDYGESDGQLANLPEGNFAAAISSPPFGEGETRDRTPVQPGDIADCITRAYTQDRQGTTEGNLAALLTDEAGLAAAISSPPHAAGCQHTGGDDPQSQHIQGGEYRTLGIAGAISSPPYAESLASDDPDKRKGLYRDPKRRNDRTLTAEYGQSEGQLGQMRDDGFGAAVSSPPYEGSEGSPSLGSVNKDDWGNNGHDIVARRGLSANYGSSNGQLGHTEGDTFWSAARTIVEQAYHALRPGAVAIWVCKDFVRDKQRVPFCDQWRRLCEACGFETLEWIRAWLVENRGAQYTLDGKLDERKIERKGFFRRLAEKKGSPRIDYEVVLVMRKGAAHAR